MNQSGRLSNPDLETSFEHNSRFREGKLEIGLSQRFPVTGRLQLEKNVSLTELKASESEVREVGRRTLEGNTVTIDFDGRPCKLPAAQWLTPYAVAARCEMLASHKDGPLVVRVPVGKGQVIVCGSYFGDAYLANEIETVIRQKALGGELVLPIDMGGDESDGGGNDEEA